MTGFRSEEISTWLGAEWERVSSGFAVRGISHDTRTLKPGEVYIALRGEQHDGHDFIPQALEKGASGLITEHDRPSFTCPQIVVPDTIQALWDMAAGVRNGWSGTVIGITGSAGKTTVKEMTASVLAQKGRTAKTRGNWNNEIGLPLSMLAADREADFFVFEIGMNHPGEIEKLAGLLRPDWAVLTDIGKAHIEFFGTVEKIAWEKAVLLAHADYALLDETSEWFDLFCSRCKGKVVRFGREPFPFTVSHPGEHMIRNARRAAALGRELGLNTEQIQAGLDGFSPASMRWETIPWNGALLINDAYNASPLSMRASLSAFASLPGAGRKFAVLGAMHELGELSAEEHRDLGRFADSLNLDEVITIGPGGAQIRCRGVSGVSKEEAAVLIRQKLRSGDKALFKASRREQLETIIEALIKKKDPSVKISGT